MEVLKTVAKVGVAAAGGVIIGDMIAGKVAETEFGKKLSADNARAARIGIQAGVAAVAFGVLNSVL